MEPAAATNEQALLIGKDKEGGRGSFRLQISEAAKFLHRNRRTFRLEDSQESSLDAFGAMSHLAGAPSPPLPCTGFEGLWSSVLSSFNPTPVNVLIPIWLPERQTPRGPTPALVGRIDILPALRIIGPANFGIATCQPGQNGTESLRFRTVGNKRLAGWACAGKV